MTEFLIVWYLLTGIVSGFLGGLLGIGGGIVIVPALILMFDATGSIPLEHSTPVAVATSLACIVFTSLSAAWAQLRADMVEWMVVRRWLIPVVIGSLAAGYIAPMLGVTAFRTFIGVFLGFVSIIMLTSWKPSPHRQFPGPLSAGAVGAVAGLVSGIAGIGGGNVMVPTQVFFNIPVHRATATSSTLGVAVAGAGALGYIIFATDFMPDNEALLGYVYLPAFAAIVVGAVVSAPLGVKVAHRIEPMWLRRSFGVLLVLVAARMLWTA